MNQTFAKRKHRPEMFQINALKLKVNGKYQVSRKVIYLSLSERGVWLTQTTKSNKQKSSVIDTKKIMCWRLVQSTRLLTFLNPKTHCCNCDWLS